MVYKAPNTEGSLVKFNSRYGNYIGGEFVEPVKGNYFENTTPVTGKVFCEVARSTAEDVEKALDAAHKAAPGLKESLCVEILNGIGRIQVCSDQIAHGCAGLPGRERGMNPICRRLDTLL